VSFAGDTARVVWNILNNLSEAMDEPDGDFIAESVAGDTESGLFRAVVRLTLRDMSMALGQPGPTRGSMPMTYAEKVEYRPRLLENARGMLADVDVQLEALERMPEILLTVQSAESRAEAAGRLKEPPFNYNQSQAFYVLELTVASQTAAGLARFRERRAELIEAIRRLEQPIEPPDAP
jgi:hypothetical protein